MTSENSSASLEAVSAIKRELDYANVRYENVFVRREEIVVVLPGRGAEREAAKGAAAKAALHGKHYVTIMAEDGLPAALKAAFAVVIFAIGVFGVFLMLWGYIGAGRGQRESPESEAPAANASR
jgi:hypothetical protein